MQAWGQRASPAKWNADQSKPIQLFKLFLLNEPSMKLPELPDKRDYRRVIRDYLAKLYEMIKEKVEAHWEVDFYSQVLIVFTVCNFFYRLLIIRLSNFFYFLIYLRYR